MSKSMDLNVIPLGSGDKGKFFSCHKIKEYWKIFWIWLKTRLYQYV